MPSAATIVAGANQVLQAKRMAPPMTVRIGRLADPTGIA